MRLAVYRDGLLILHRDFSSQSIRLGRLGTCDVLLEGDDVARFHAVIDRSLDGKCFELTDLSAGSTRVNGVPVSRVKLRDGDAIRIGHYRIVVMDEADDMVIVPQGDAFVAARVARVLWSATAEEMASEPVTGEISVRQELAKLKPSGR